MKTIYESFGKFATYSVRCFCSNCRKHLWVRFRMGEPSNILERDCPNCGCKRTLNKCWDSNKMPAELQAQLRSLSLPQLAHFGMENPADSVAVFRELRRREEAANLAGAALRDAKSAITGTKRHSVYQVLAQIDAAIEAMGDK